LARSSAIGCLLFFNAKLRLIQPSLSEFRLNALPRVAWPVLASTCLRSTALGASRHCPTQTSDSLAPHRGERVRERGSSHLTGAVSRCAPPLSTSCFPVDFPNSSAKLVAMKIGMPEGRAAARKGALVSPRHRLVAPGLANCAADGRTMPRRPLTQLKSVILNYTKITHPHTPVRGKTPRLYMPQPLLHHSVDRRSSRHSRGEGGPHPVHPTFNGRGSPAASCRIKLLSSVGPAEEENQTTKCLEGGFIDGTEAGSVSRLLRLKNHLASPLPVKVSKPQ
jgi:hypothetical protein